tara:strand:- start:55 stop:351 length:297 start_codon:yes stop_codon:yes gene_type:complete
MSALDMKAEEVAEHALSDLFAKDVSQLLVAGKEKQARAVMKDVGMSKTDMDKTVKEHDEMKKQTDLEEAVDLIQMTVLRRSDMNNLVNKRWRREHGLR